MRSRMHDREKMVGEEHPEVAFESFYEKFYPFIYKYLVNRLPLEQDAEDVAQTAFLELFAKIYDPGAPQTSPKGLIYTIAKRRSLDFYKSPNYAQIHIEIGEQFPTLDESIENQSTAKETALEVRASIQMLPVISMTVIKLIYFDDMSIVEAADTLGITVGATKKRLFDARQALKEILSPINEYA